jgi:hypothetical protein
MEEEEIGKKKKKNPPKSGIYRCRAIGESYPCNDSSTHCLKQLSSQFETPRA